MTDRPAGTRQVRLSVPEMDCPSCAGSVERELERVDGIEAFETRPATGQVVVRASGDADRAEIATAIERAGYGVEDDEESDETTGDLWTSRRAIGTWIGAVLLAAGLLFEFLITGRNSLVFEMAGRPFHRSHVLFVVSVAVAGTPVVRSGARSLRQRGLDIDLLMGVGIVAALAVHLPFEAATLAVLFSVAELLERFSMDRARNSLRELMSLSPDTATVRRDTGASETPRADGETVDGEEVTVPVEDVAVGERVLVRPGEKVPVDGVVVEGTSAVDQSPITGESVPVTKAPDDEVYAGTINEEGYLEVETTAPASETTLSRIVELVEDAQGNETNYEQFVDRFAGYYTPIVVAGAVLTVLVPPLLFGGPWRTWFVRGLTLLVIACPCAFVISTPVSVVSGVTSAARNGVLIKGGNHLEAMADVDVVAIDKTGTLTRGELRVTDAIPLDGTTEEELLRCARAIERRSEHPIATAVVEYAERAGVDDRAVERFETLTGEGVRADLDGVTHYAGKPELFAELGFDLDHVRLTTDGGVCTAPSPELCESEDCRNLLEETVPRLEREGKTIVLVGTEERLGGLIAIADEVRPDARWAVERLQSRGVDVVMLTGDNEGTARAIAEQVGVDEFRADLLPEEKVAAVEELQRERGEVAMVGDGINDAPALATATVGIAMGSAGTDTALETADIALMADDIAKLPYLRALSERSTAVIRQNIWSSLGVKAALAAGAPFGYVPVWLAIVVGDMGMSLGVTGNAMRLANVAPEEPDERD